MTFASTRLLTVPLGARGRGGVVSSDEDLVYDHDEDETYALLKT